MECVETVLINDLDKLFSLKREIQDRIVQPIDWTEHMELYTQVRCINEKIKQIQGK